MNVHSRPRRETVRTGSELGMENLDIDKGREAEALVTRIKVDIFDRSYWLRSDGDGEYLTELATYVDALMREIASGGQGTDSLKIAIVAALSMTDELYTLRKLREDHDDRVEAISSQCSSVLDEILEGPSEEKPSERDWNYEEVFAPRPSNSIGKLRAQITSRLLERRLKIQSLLDET